MIGAISGISYARADVIISEIMYNPQGTDLDTTVTPNISREWVELYNTGATSTDLSGWQFGDQASNSWASAFPAGTSLASHQALVVTGDTTSFDKEWGAGINRIQVTGFPVLGNNPTATSDRPAIRNGSGAVQDNVSYDDENGWPRVNGSDGQSIALVPQGLSATANNIPTNWKPSMRGVYGAVYKSADGENHGSPGVVDTTPQIPFTPSPDAAWSMVYLPDTQNYVKSSTDFHIGQQQTQWIKDHLNDFKIKLVIQGGDIVNNNDTNDPTSGDQNSTQQWQNAKTMFSTLNGVVPYVVAAGNHDFGFTNADNRDTMINSYFKADDNPLVDPAKGGIMKAEMTPGQIQNAYYAFTAPDGRKMLVFSLEWEPQPATVAWANSIAALPQYAGYTATLLTHNYLQGDNTRSTSTNVAADYSGQELWDGLIKTHPNFEMTFNGHFGGDGAGVLRSTDNAGKGVEQMFFNSQFETFGGDGWLRVVEFLQDGKTVRVRTYSPYHDLYRTGPDYEFTFTLSSLSILPGDYNRDGKVDMGDYVVWRDSVGEQGYFAADGNGDQIVDVNDYNVWRQHYGQTSGSGAGEFVAVPEPACAAMMVLGLCLASTARRGRLQKPARNRLK
ncbi:MAG TPA: lamin tail domain-containing protein [Lacipirellulaceae bacterium]|nr:lamin tail domain-containing protein [Lacipirellulaceae bacterium]